ncbi:RelA/SpoT domain-containing protein [uncultured Sphingomonas sp.]|uniref:RelA/SpoT domain-containing protein n=1 Tax=uncultured Sphingomonas sp. TaxID=158754 RepID=UPI0025FFB4C3|nr:RelA/SpoT domain-containing protein [uncultured Sphingomonas sp.]
MTWIAPEHKPEIVNAAGRLLSHANFPALTPDEQKALEVINNWRSAHAYPLNTFQINLRRRAKKIDSQVIIAQRAKRLDSIHRKLIAKPTMRMTQMQDIAGCRAVMRRVSKVYQLAHVYQHNELVHTFRNSKDYIEKPKPDGYRSIHLVYEYKGTKGVKDYDGLRVEVQIRSQYQHAWATAVEAVGVFTRQALKSNQGDKDWLRFFALMSNAVAAIEKCPPVPGTPGDKSALLEELAPLAKKLRAVDTLRAYNTTLDLIGGAKDAKYFIVELEPDLRKVTVRRYKAQNSAQANDDYTRIESEIGPNSLKQVVLVSVSDINSLKRAYPNYFLDTAMFSGLVDRVLKGRFPDPLPPQMSLFGRVAHL